MVSGIVCDAATRAIILNSIAFVRFANCEFDAALRVIDAILALPEMCRRTNSVAAQILRGIIDMCLGDSDEGRRHFRQGLEQAHTLAALNYATMTRITREPLRCWVCARPTTWSTRRVRRCGARNRLGDVSGIIATLWAHGTVLLRAANTSHDEAIDLLERARVLIEEHKLQHHRVDEHCRRSGDRCRPQGANRRSNRQASSHVLAALRRVAVESSWAVRPRRSIELLVDRGSVDDLTEAHRIVDRWQALAARYRGDGSVVAEIPRAVGRGGRQPGRVRRTVKDIPRVLREARCPRSAARGAPNGR